jgi:signal transduction histidine kinase
MVTMCVWIFDVALASVLNAGRYDLGWYAGRIYGLLAASFVLIVLLLENSVLYAQLVRARENERQRAQAALARHEERLRILHEIDGAIVGGRALQSIAGAVIQPLRTLLGVPRAIVNVFDLQTGEVEWLAAAGRHRTHVGPGVRYPIRLMGDVEALKRGEPQVIHTGTLPPGPEVEALLASSVHVYMAVPMISGDQLIGAISFGGEEAAFPPEQVGIASEVATQLAIAITQARLLERVRRHAEELEVRVGERTAELQAANRELEAFSYSVSHDLRSPLRAIDGYALMLAEDYGPRLDDEGRRLVSVVRQSAATMGQLIEDLLRFAQAGRASLVASPLEVGALVRGVVGDIAPAYPKARIELGALPAAVGDAALLKQVWTNLIVNALKYSANQENSRVEIGGRADGSESIYWVRDNGAGFDMRYADKLFKVFQRLHRPEEFEGTGVGLAIVQRVVMRHGGRVWAEGKPGEGACFYFTLPAAGER